MKTKLFSFLCFVFIFLLFPITSNAYSMEEITNSKTETIQEVENLQSKLGVINLELSSIEQEIEYYGINYQPYNSYQQVVSSTSEQTTKETYSIDSNSFVTINEVSQSDITLGELLEEKEFEKTEIENKINTLNDKITKLEKIENITFDSSDVTKLSGMTVEDVQFILEGTALEELAAYFIEAEQEYQVNAIFIISICALESGWGTSDRAIYDNNLTGFGVYSDDSEGINSDTKRGNILLTAKTLHNNYLTEGGSCYNGVSVEAVSIKYCASDTWAGKITNIGNNLYNECISYYLNS